MNKEMNNKTNKKNDNKVKAILVMAFVIQMFFYSLCLFNDMNQTKFNKSTITNMEKIEREIEETKRAIADAILKADSLYSRILQSQRESDAMKEKLLQIKENLTQIKKDCHSLK